MGISSRDYVRESSGRNRGFGDDTPGCKWLIIITGVVFLLQLVVTHPVGDPELRAFGVRESYLNDWFELSLNEIRYGQIWRFVTYAFLHDRDSIWHLVFNMLGLWWFGSEMERLYGTKEFTCFYLAAAAASGAGFILWQLVTTPAGALAVPVVGASGAVLAALTLYATHYPREKLGLFYGLIFIEVRWVVLLYAAVDLLPVLKSLQGEPVYSSVAHAAHLIGMLFGWLYRHYAWNLSSGFDLSALKKLPRRWRQTQAKKSLRVFDPEPEVSTGADLESEVDRILAKIHEHGSGSLTDKEQSILTKASQQYKNRR